VSKITISICKVYKNTGRFRFHRKKTKPSWKHYFLSDDYTDEYTFGTEWISNIKAMILKRKVHRIRKYLCTEFVLVTIVAVFIQKEKLPNAQFVIIIVAHQSKIHPINNHKQVI